MVAGTRPPTHEDLESPEPSGTLGDRFREVVFHKDLRPSGLTENDVRFVSDDLQTAWLDFASKLASAMREPSEDLDCLFEDLESFFPRKKSK